MSIDSLNIQITADATKASNAIDGLVRRLDLLTKELGKVNGNKLTNFSTSIDTISGAMNRFSSIKLPDFNRVVKGINKFATIDTSKLAQVGADLTPLANSISAFSNINFDNRNLQGFINSLSRLASANVGSLANADFNALGQSLNQLATSLSNAPKIQQSVIQMTSAIANLAKSGANIPTVVNSLPTLSTSLNQFMIAMSSAPAMASGTITFTTAIAQLANAGNRAAASATGLLTLGANLRTVIESLAGVPAVNSSVIQLVSALAQLSRTGTGASGALKTLSSRFKSYSLSALTASKHTNTLANSFGRLYAKVWSLVRIFRLFKKTIDISAQMTEVQNLIDVTFKDAAYKVEKLADVSIEKFGMSELTLKQTAGMFQALGSNAGIETSAIAKANKYLSEHTNGYVEMSDSIADVSLNLTKLTADMESLYGEALGLDFDDIAQDLQSIYTGTTKPLRQYGIDLAEANLKAWALSEGLNSNIKKMTQAEKAMLRYQYVLSHTTAAHGDFERTSQSWSNQIRILKQNFEQLGSVIGRTAIAALKPLVQALNSAMKHIIAFAETISNALGQIFGWEFEKSGGGSGLGNEADNADDLADGLADATENAKKLKQQLAGFDELEIIQSKDEDASGGGVSGGGVSPPDMGWTEQESIVDSFTSKINSLYELGKHIGDTLTKTLNGINWENIYQGARNFGTGLAQFLNGLISPDLFGEVGNTIASALNTIIYGALSFGEEFDWENFGLSIASGINNFFDTFDFTALAESLNAWVGGLWTTIKTAIFGDENGENGIDFSKIFSGLGEFVSSLEPLSAFVLLIASAVPATTLFSTAMSALSPIFTVLSSIMGGVNTAFTAFAGFITSASAPVLILVGAISALVVGLTATYATNEEVRNSFAQATDSIAQNLTPALQLITDTILPDLQNGWKRVTEIMKPFGDFLQNTFVSIWQDMINPALSYIGNTVLPTLITTFENLWSKILVPFATFVGNVFAPIIRLISGLLEMLWKNIIVPLANMIGGVLSSVFEGLAGILNNTIIPVVGFVIDLFNTLWNYVFGPLVDFLVDNFLPIFESVFETIGGLIDGATKIFTGLIDFVSGVFSLEWGKAWEGVKDVFKGIFNGIASIVEGVINFIIGAINTFLNGFNGVVTSVGDVIGIDISIPTIPKVEIPKFATGGFPKEDGLFMANHTELVGKFSNGRTAVANNNQITTGIANAVYPAVYNAVSEAMRNNPNSGSPEIRVFVGDKELTDIAIQGINDIFRRTGRTPIMI